MRRSATFGCIAWLVTATLLAQSWLGHLATAALAAEVDAVVICTGSGFKIISLPDGLGPPADPLDTGDGDHERGKDCTACLVQAAFQAITHGAPSIALWRWPEFVTTTSDVLPAPTSSHRAHPSRAPPPA